MSSVMSAKSKLTAKLVRLAMNALIELANNRKVQKAALGFAEDLFKNLSDFFQVATGQVNQQTCEQAIESAVTSCIRQDEESLTRVTAFVSALYAQHEIHRGAQVGGSLRQRFGPSWFPHIKERELRYALKVDRDLEDYLFDQIRSAASDCE